MLRKFGFSSLLFFSVFILLCFVSVSDVFADYSQHPKAKNMIREMSAEHDYPAGQLAGYLRSASKKQSILDAISKPAERLSWERYSHIFLTQKRLQSGLAFVQQYKPALQKAAQMYGVDMYVIAAILGVETSYGQNKGSYQVLDALATLAFDYPRRSSFFYKELKSFLLLVEQEQLDINQLKGSYAGAMGWPQFMPSSFIAYAVDFDQDGQINIWDDPMDAIGSIAHYLAEHGWQTQQPVVLPAVSVTPVADKAPSVINQSLKPKWSKTLLADTYGIRIKKPFAHQVHAQTLLTPVQLDDAQGQAMELWLGLHNFYAIARYNPSRLYVMAVYQLSQALKTGRLPS